MGKKYTKKQIDDLKKKYVELRCLISGLDTEYERHFTLDGHLVGSIGEVLASYYYGIDLSRSGSKVHDGSVDGKLVQIKVTQGRAVVIKDKPEFLLVLLIKENGDICEVYNGPGDIAFEVASKQDGYNHHHMQVSSLIKQSKKVGEDLRLKQKHKVSQYEK